MAEPKWRTVLCWGSVVTFLTLPLIVLGAVILSHEMGWEGFEEQLKSFKFLGTFYQSVTGLTFGLSGLHSLDRFGERKNGNGNIK